MLNLNKETMPSSAHEKNISSIDQKRELMQNSNNQVAPPQAESTNEMPSRLIIRFIKDKAINILTEKAPEAPVLIKFIEGSKTFLRKGIVGQLVGAGGIGKTHWLTQLALSVATGTVFLKKYSVVKGHVFLGLGENSDDDIHRLVKKMVDKLFPAEIQLTNAGKHLAIMSFTGIQASFLDKNNFETPTYKDFLSELIKKEPPEGWSLIILDPISRFLGANAETDNAAATQFISLLEKIIQELRGKPTILFGHHMSKAHLSNNNTDQTASRGSSALTDGVRWQANLDRVMKDEDKDNNTKISDPSKISLKVVKSNFTGLYDPHILYKDEAGCLYSIEDAPAQVNAKSLADHNSFISNNTNNEPNYSAAVRTKSKR